MTVEYQRGTNGRVHTNGAQPHAAEEQRPPQGGRARRSWRSMLMPVLAVVAGALVLRRMFA
jgi:hypothetical protein